MVADSRDSNWEDLGYGWTFMSKVNIRAREWFYDAVDKDSSYADGFNGIGGVLENYKLILQLLFSY